jgi:hypothetical protein
VKHASLPTIQMSASRWFGPARLALLALLAAMLAGGCQRQGGAAQQGIVPTDPEVASNLASLSRELRKAMPHHQLTRNFDDFVAATQIQVPAPPTGQKYAINEKWRVILVDAK